MSLIDQILNRTARATEIARITALHKATGAALSALRSKSGSRKPAGAPAQPGAKKRRVVRKANDGQTFVVEDIDANDVQVRDIDAADAGVYDIDVPDVQVR